METLKTPSKYSVDFNRRFQGFSMANLEKGDAIVFLFYKTIADWPNLCKRRTGSDFFTS